MGLFDGMASATRAFGSNKLTEGDYVARIDRCDVFKTDISGNCYKITLTILGVTDGPHKVGEVATVVFGDKRITEKQWLGNIKGFIAGVMNVDDSKIGAGETQRTLAEFKDANGNTVVGENCMAGEVCRVKATQRKSKNSKDPKTGEAYDYSIYNWSPSLSAEEITEALGAEAVKRFFPSGL